MREPTPFENAVASSPLFKGYCQAISAEFRFLETEFLFRPSEPRILNYEWEFAYRNETTCAIPYYELGGLPTVLLCSHKVVKGVAREGSRFDLNYLSAVRCPERRLTSYQPIPYSAKDFTDPVPAERAMRSGPHDVLISPWDFTPIFRHYAGVLKECAADVLRGDFSIVKEIKKITDQENRQRYREERKKRAARRRGQ